MPSLTSQFVAEIERRILTGEWQAGQIIPPFRALASSFNVSRSVINAGIAELSNNGYLITVPRQHTIVANWKKHGTMAILDGMISHNLFDEEFINNLLESRWVIETTCARLASERRTAQDLDELRVILQAEKNATSLEEKVSADVRFHHMIAACSHNVVFSLMLNSYAGIITQLVRAFYENNPDREFVNTKHQILYQALLEKDTDLAVDTMQSLLQQGEDVIRQIYFKED